MTSQREKAKTTDIVALKKGAAAREVLTSFKAKGTEQDQRETHERDAVEAGAKTFALA